MNFKGDILLVEDNVDDAFLIQHWLKKQGVDNRVIHLPSYGEARRFFRDGAVSGSDSGTISPVLILLSTSLAGGGGLELLGWLRKNPRFNRALVLALGNSRLRDDIQHVYDLGANGYFAKGIDFDDLAGALHSLDFLEANT